MQLDVVIEPTFRFPYVKYLDKQMGQWWTTSDGSLVMISFSSELFSGDFWYSDRRTEGKRCIRAHHVLAQVGSKLGSAPWCTKQVGGAQFRLVVHNIALYHCSVVQHSPHKPRQTESDV